MIPDNVVTIHASLFGVAVILMDFAHRWLSISYHIGLRAYPF